MKWLAAIWVVVLLALHQDNWLWTNKYLVFGFLPIGLVYHALYAVAAALTMWMLVKVAWPKHLDDASGETEHEGGRP
jgi:zinc transporter ZupT